MTARTVAATKAAHARARERRAELDESRAAAEQRQDVAAATTLVALERLAQVEATRDAAPAEVGAAVRALIDQDVTDERAAGLLDIDVAQVRRLSKITPVEPPAAPARSGSGAGAGPSSARTAAPGPAAGGTATLTSLPDHGGSGDAARRAG